MTKFITVGALLFILLIGIWCIPTPEPGVLPGGHTTIFIYDFLRPIGQVFTGLVGLQIALLLLQQLRPQNWYSTDRMDTLNWLILLFGAFSSGMNLFIGLIQPVLNGMWQYQVEMFARVTGNNTFLYISALLISLLLPLLSQLFWVKRIRQNARLTLVICLLISLPILVEFAIICCN
jgi:hypothetical protein